jgi:hypothetical protein
MPSTNSVSWSHDGKRIVSADSAATLIWDASSGTLLLYTDDRQAPQERKMGAVEQVAWSRDDRRVLITGWSRVAIWQLP